MSDRPEEEPLSDEAPLSEEIDNEEGKGIFLTEQQPGGMDDGVNMEVAVPEGEQEGEEDLKIEYSPEEIASFKSIFDMFDKEGKGLIDMQDFLSIMASLNREETEVREILEEWGFDQTEGRMNFDDFIGMMMALEKRIILAERAMDG